MLRVLITGAAGFIGMHTAIRFLEEGWNVVGLDNLNDYYSVDLKKARLTEIRKVEETGKSSFEFHERDLNSDVWLELKNLKFNVIIHLAAQAGVRYSIENPMAYLNSNILGFQRVLDFVKDSKCTKFLYASSSSVYGKNAKQPFIELDHCNAPESYYAATKKANELMAYSYFRTNNISSMGMRFFTVYGPWGRPDMAPILFANAAKNGETISVFNYGNQERDFTFITDIVEAIYLLSQQKFNGAQIVNVGNGSPVKLMRFIEELERNFKTTISKDFIAAQNGDVVTTFANTTKLHDLTGFKPRISIRQGIKEFVEWYKKYNY